MGKIFLSHSYYVPEDDIDLDLVRKHLDKYVYYEAKCAKCPFKAYRFSGNCLDCQGYIGHVKLWRRKTLSNGITYVLLPNGNRAWLEKKLNIDLSEAIDRRSKVPFKNRIKFLSTLYKGEVVAGTKTVNQQRIVREVLDNDANGIILSPTRSGKTVFSLNLAHKLGCRTLILASKTDWLEQFVKRLKEHTNVEDIDARFQARGLDRHSFGIVKKTSDFNKYEDFVLCTYQMLITALGKKRLAKYVRKKFGTLIVDEVHLANAFAFSQVVSSIDTRYKIGLSAEPKRKDGQEWIMDRVIGPIISRGEDVGLRPEVLIIKTGLKPKNPLKVYPSQMKWLSEHKARNILIVKKTFEILRSDPLRTVLIPCVRVDHVKFLVDMINKQALYNNENKGESWSSNLALAFHGKTLNRETILEAFRKGSATKVAVVMRQMSTEALDIGAWTDLIHSFLFANPPKTYQLCSRVCTPYDGKPQPRIHTVVDSMGLTLGCFRSTYETYKQRKYIISNETKRLADELGSKTNDGPGLSIKNFW